ncbi:ADP-ribosylation factor-like protein 3 [Nymphon striatum]|nr:ADP-ribosylation factor-like protein 3 [Nymphon striatum]
MSPRRFVNPCSHTKIALIVGGSIIAGASAYAAYMYYQIRRTRLADEGFVEAVRLPDEVPTKRVLVMGLDNSGKSTFLSHLSNIQNSDIINYSNNDDKNKKIPKPTEGFNIVSVKSSKSTDCNIDFWERVTVTVTGVTVTGVLACPVFYETVVSLVGHKKNMRSYWSNYFQDTDLLIFCVDSADEDRLVHAYDEFHSVQADEKLKGVPILILAIKQDIVGALSVEEIKAALDIDSISAHNHKIEALALTLHPHDTFKENIQKTEALIHKLCMCK